MSMKSINFQTGVKTYALNGDENNVLSINVGDPNLEARINRAEKEVDAISDRFNSMEKMTAEEREALDKEIKALIDRTFNADISSKVFGETSCFTLLENGNLLFQSFIDAFLPVVMSDFEKVSEAFAKNSAKKTDAYIAAAESIEPDEAAE